MAGYPSERALLSILGQGLWQKPEHVIGVSGGGARSAASLWTGVQPNRLGTLGLLRELRDTVHAHVNRWDPSSRYGHLDAQQYKQLGTNFDRLLDQLHPLDTLQPRDLDVIRGYQKNPSEYRWTRNIANKPVDQHQRDLYDLLQASELPVDLNTYRGLTVRSDSSADRLPLFTSPPREGDVLGTRGFTSTSVDPSSAWDFISGADKERSYLADIYLPEGSRALPIRTGDQYDAERELLLSPGTRFRVASDPEPLPDFNAHRLRLEALHPSDPYQAPSELQMHDVPVFTTGPATVRSRSRGHYAKSGVLGYLAGLGPVAALATPGIMDLYTQSQEPQ